jgi:hypothetical protein
MYGPFPKLCVIPNVGSQIVNQLPSSGTSYLQVFDYFKEQHAIKLLENVIALNDQHSAEAYHGLGIIYSKQAQQSMYPLIYFQPLFCIHSL